MGFRLIIEDMGQSVKDWMGGEGSGMAPKAGKGLKGHNADVKAVADEDDKVDGKDDKVDKFSFKSVKG